MSKKISQKEANQTRLMLIFLANIGLGMIFMILTDIKKIDILSISIILLSIFYIYLTSKLDYNIFKNGLEFLKVANEES